MGESQVRLAVAQISSVQFDKQATIAKVCIEIQKAAAQNVQVLLFPEALVPGYPRGMDFGVVVGSRTTEGKHLWQHYWEQSVTIPGPELNQVAQAAAKANMAVALGVIEKASLGRSGTLYCTMVYFGPDGSILGIHRKLKPTAAERYLWGEGDGSTMPVVQTPFGRMGGLICWENYMPLARMALYQEGVEIYLAPTADARECWLSSMRHIALEGRCFVLSCNQFAGRDDLPKSFQESVSEGRETRCRGGSVIVSPMGDVLAGPLWDGEGLLTADVDLGEIVRARFDFDVVGHYARPDVFELIVNREGRLGDPSLGRQPPE